MAQRHTRTTLFMYSLLVPLLLCFILFTERLSCTEATHRITRALAFRKGSSFFYRLNYKINSFPHTRIFSQAAGFKMAWELPSKNEAATRVGRSISEVHECTALMYDSHGFDGRACLSRNICSMLEYAELKDGVMAKILKLFAGSHGINGTLLDDAPVSCKENASSCPLRFLDANVFSDNQSKNQPGVSQS